MSVGSITLPMIQAILPEILILILGLLVLAVDLALPEKRRGVLGWITAGGLALIIGVGNFIWQTGTRTRAGLGRYVTPGLAWFHVLGSCSFLLR